MAARRKLERVWRLYLIYNQDNMVFRIPIYQKQF